MVFPSARCMLILQSAASGRGVIVSGRGALRLAGSFGSSSHAASGGISMSSQCLESKTAGSLARREQEATLRSRRCSQLPRCKTARSKLAAKQRVVFQEASGVKK